jgi:hypothetical protein
MTWSDYEQAIVGNFAIVHFGQPERAMAEWKDRLLHPQRTGAVASQSALRPPSQAHQSKSSSKKLLRFLRWP